MNRRVRLENAMLRLRVQDLVQYGEPTSPMQLLQIEVCYKCAIWSGL